jgi:hypothetical protein
VAGSYEHDNETSGCIKREGFLGHLSHYQSVKNGSPVWS